MNGVFQNLNDDFTTETNMHLANGALNIADEMADLRRQVIFLQGQLDDKDRTIHHLQVLTHIIENVNLTCVLCVEFITQS